MYDPTNIWIIEDEPAFQDKLVEALVHIRGDFAIRRFENAEDCLKAMEICDAGQFPELFFVDNFLPGRPGTWFVSELQRRDVRVPSILMSSADRGKLVQDIGATRAAAFLVKPANFNSEWRDQLRANINFAMSRSANIDAMDADLNTKRVITFYGGFLHDFGSAMLETYLCVEEIDKLLERHGFARGHKARQRAREALKELNDAEDAVNEIEAITNTGGVEIRPEPVASTSLAASVTKAWRHEFDHFSSEVSKMPLELDVKKTKNLLDNLMQNARKYAKHEEPSHCELVIRENEEDPLFVDLIVRDRGIGFPGQNLGSFPMPGHRLSNVGSRKGSGRGLAFVKAICEAHVCATSGKPGSLDACNRPEAHGGAVLTATLPKRAKSQNVAPGDEN